MEIGFADLPALKGRRLVGDWFAVDADRVPLFEHATYVDQNLHVMDGYPDQLVEGFHLVALLDHLLNRMLRVGDDATFGWNYGLDRVRFVSPVLAGERMRAHVHVTEVRPRGEGFLTRFDVDVEVEGRERPGFVAEQWVYWLPSAPAPEAERRIGREEDAVEGRA